VGRFETTLWSRIQAASAGAESAARQVVEAYRPALVRFVRLDARLPADEAEDVVQEVLLRLFSKDLLAKADQERGRFRSYLLGITKNVLREARDKAAAQRRGGDRTRVPLEAVGDVAAPSAPEFDARWAHQLLQLALDALERTNPRQHQALRLRTEEALSHEAIAARMDRTASQVKSDLHLARKALARSIRSEIARYASSEEELADELALLKGVIAQR
jgi:RNA polymerase sigma factor (sigma-70 family)